MRLFLLTLVAVVGCAAHAPDVAVPPVTPGVLGARAVAAPHLGDVQPIAVAVTNGRDGTVHLDPRQLFALDGQGARVAPLPPAEAARRAGGGTPSALKGGVTGAAAGGVFGALGGVIAGAIQGGIGAAVAAGSAVGAAIGAITGTISGARDGGGAHAAEFQDRALPEETLASGFSASGYVYYPAGSYRTIELLATGEPSGAVVRERIDVE
jgi:hypothetical protein